MLKAINDKINKVKEDLALKKVLEEKREKFRRESRWEKNALKQLRITLAKELKDVEKLEKLSISNFIATIMNNKDEKLEKEHEEYFKAKLKFDEQSAKVNMIDRNLENVEERLRNLRNCEREYKELLDKKLEIIKSSGDYYVSSKLSELELDIDKALKAQKEIEEAESVGRSLVGAIDAAQDSLESAQGWGLWDMMGGDMLSSIAKHNNINDAEESYIYISNLLQSFNKELGDVNFASLSFSSTTIAFDIFFDNIFTDFAVQSKINDALSNTSYLRKNVSDVMNKLEQEREELSLIILNKRKEYEEFIETL
ncbi:MAG: hypothetical protein E6344_05445 [Clostridium sp.]|nr:hypothetical protein [Clostridium sp.]MDU7083115.1 hypothetical protein [Clostridium sp.]